MPYTRVYSPESLAVAMLSARKKKKMTQTEAGDLVGVLQKTVSAFENNPSTTKLHTLFSLLAALNLDLYITQRGHYPFSEKIEDQI